MRCFLLRLSIVFLIVLNAFADRKILKHTNKYLDDIDKFIGTAGYSSEVHEVETEDGYLLRVHRIMPLKPLNIVRKGPVFLMHGLFCTAADYVMTGPDIALSYYLVDNGYDVWLGNSRGSRHCMKHKTFTPETKEFWNFSWHEIGFYDLPAMIDYMLKIANKPAAFYVGHSQGTTSLMVLLSSRPEYNQKIIQGHLLTPAVFMKNCPHPAARILSSDKTQKMMDRMGLYRTEPFIKNAEVFGDVFCTEKSTNTVLMCQNLLLSVVGRNKGDVIMDTSIIADLPKHISAAISFKQPIHYMQSLISGKFQRYDYLQQNLKHYNSSTPPDYQLSNVKAAMYLYHGTEDLLIGKLDVETLRDKLPNVKAYRVMRNWNHVDFVYGKTARTALYGDILKNFNSV